MLSRFFASTGVQSVLAALGRGLVMAAMAYAGMLVKHVTDTQTIVGTVILVALLPLSGLLHLVVPAVPGGATMAARWPRIGSPPADPPPTTIDPPAVNVTSRARNLSRTGTTIVETPAGASETMPPH